MQIRVSEEKFDIYPYFSYLENIFRMSSMRNVIVSGPMKFILECLKLAELPADTNIRLHQISDCNPVTSLFFVIYPQNNEKILLKNRGRIQNLHLPGMQSKLNAIQRYSYLGSIVNLHQNMVTHSLGNLLHYLDAHWKYIFLSESNITTITNLKSFNIQDMVLMDNSTFLALNIFSPNDDKGNDNTLVDSFSLYGLLNKCCSKYGSAELKMLMMRPICNVHEIQFRHSIIEWCMRKENAGPLNKIKKHLKTLCNINRVHVKMLLRPKKKPAYLKSLRETIKEINAICEISSDVVASGETNNFFQKLANETNFKTVLDIIENVTDVDQSVLENRFIIQPEFDPILTQLKATLEVANMVIIKSLETNINEYSDKFCSFGLIYKDTVGFVLGTYTFMIFFFIVR